MTVMRRREFFKTAGHVKNDRRKKLNGNRCYHLFYRGRFDRISAE